MVSKSLSKLSQNIVKRKGKNAPLHENSRDSRRLRTATSREDKLAKLARSRKRQNNPLLDRITFFRAAILSQPPASAPLTLDDLHELINAYLSRHESALTAIAAHRTPNRPTSTTEDLQAHARAAEEKEYAAGFWTPDLRDAKNVEVLREWNGVWSGLGRVAFVRVQEDGGVRESQFPPTGMS